MTGMTEIVKTITRLLAGLIFFYGVYIVLCGDHLTLDHPAYLLQRQVALLQFVFLR